MLQIKIMEESSLATIAFIRSKTMEIYILYVVKIIVGKYIPGVSEWGNRKRQMSHMRYY